MIAAAGSGTRLGAGGPKALAELAGRPLAAWAVEAALGADSVDRVIVAAPPGAEAELGAALPDGPVDVVAGGDSRSASVARALAHAADAELVAVHDAARPLAEPVLFDATLAALDADAGAAGAIAAAPLADTVKRARAGQPPEVAETLEREGLWAVQTPQAFRAGALRAALDLPAGELARATDDAMLVERAGGRVVIVAAPAWNLKVTTADDLRLAELLLSART